MSSGYPPPPNMSMMGDKPKKKRPSNTGSKLLDNQENYFLFSILGNDNICLSAAVVELLTCEERHWKRKLRGIICLVKDYINRAYFLRIYNLISSKEIWSFKFYKGFQVEVGENCPELIFFEGEDHRIYGLNFASAEEARDFKVHFDKRREQENKSISGNKGSAPLPPASSPYTPSSVRTPSIPPSGVTPLGTMPHTDKPSIGFFRKDKDKKKQKNKIRKEDISNPTNFQHKAHVGWDQDSGFSNNVFDSEPMDESIRDIIKAAGQDPSSMSKKTMRFVYDFIDKYNAEELVEPSATPAPYKTPPPAVPISQPISQWNQPTPPPPPSRLSSHQTSHPPARPPPPVPSYTDLSSRAARPLPQVPSVPAQNDTNRPAVVPPPPPPPPPMAPMYSSNSSIPPPPPPPPPPVLSSNSDAIPPPPPPMAPFKDMPAQQSGRSNLLAEIQAGKKLKSVGEPVEKANPSNARGDMMAQIRQGTRLKHVDKIAEDDRRKSAAPLSDMGGIAGALAKALEERRVNLGIDDSSDEEDSDDKNEWSD